MESSYKLPEGRYTMLNASVRLTYGGATRSQLLRARLFSEYSDQRVELATFDAFAEYDTERELLRDKGLLPGTVTLRNLYEELSTSSDLGQFSSTPLADIPAWYQETLTRDYVIEYAKNGTPWRRAIDVNGDRRSFYFQYLRSDGSIYATVDRRIGGSDWDRQERGVVLTDVFGNPVAVLASIPELINSWIRIMGAGEDRHFLIFDSKESGRLIAEHPREANQFLLLTAHTPHLQPPRHWNSPAATTDWQETISGLQSWDAFIVLSDAHRHDLELAHGKVNNIFVLPHPIGEVDLPTEDARDPALAMIVCRLEKQKRIEDALQAFRRVVDELPGARLEIYGEGSKRTEWQELTQALGLSDSVSFLGYDPNPGKQYRRASAFLMTSLFEAQPLALLEAISHGSPIVAYDIKYGPAQMVQHGENGYLVPEGDINDFAQKTVAILSNTTLSAQMSKSSLTMSENFQLPRFFAAWSELLDTICDQKSSRSALMTIKAEIVESAPVFERPFNQISINEVPDCIDVVVRTFVQTHTTNATFEDQLKLQLRVQNLESPGVVFLSTSYLREPGSQDQFIVAAQILRKDIEKHFPDATQGFELWCEATFNNAHSLVRCGSVDTSSNRQADLLLEPIERRVPRLEKTNTTQEVSQSSAKSGALNLKLLDDVDAALGSTREKPYFIYLNDTGGVLEGRSTLKAAHQDQRIKKSVNALAQRGYYVYHTTGGVSKFVKDEHIPRMWNSVQDGTYSVSDEGVIHILEEPLAGVRPRKLIVVFSSIGDIFNDGLFRFFTRNYRSIQKFVPQDAAILRIADVGGVVGAFYLNTAYRTDNVRRISALIEKTRERLGLSKDDVITYGASKGATGALFHAVTNGYRSLSVEPILNDHYYENTFGDTHFTKGGNFPSTKEMVFEALMCNHKSTLMKRSERSLPRIVVIYSEQSPQSRYIDHLLAGNLASDISVVNVTHPSIKDHPDVSPASLNLAATFLNMLCYNFAIPGGHFSLRCE
ncbi:XcbB/CpsF family capsular polysaccharide biosynthesis protein [Arthrobacter antioxidans]|uniref:XcbB/CpsF family capsular polysaccharide biosynthesis protein n=1 Tax=Arthrobacter antioxidans TaxID=2895818 RepID=UPI001FFF6A85|nr:XcbB/CpsF family capsular polysaccharide biosynthesis protein [Arthrobacter antioxidans]